MLSRQVSPEGLDVLNVLAELGPDTRTQLAVLAEALALNEELEFAVGSYASARFFVSQLRNMPDTLKETVRYQVRVLLTLRAIALHEYRWRMRGRMN